MKCVLFSLSPGSILSTGPDRGEHDSVHHQENLGPLHHREGEGPHQAAGKECAI